MSIFHRSLFVIAHSLGQPDFYSVFQHLMKNQWKPFTELIAELDKQLRHMIPNSTDYFPYYHTLFKNDGIRPDIFKIPDNLQQLLVLTNDLQIFGSNHLSHHFELRGIYSNVSPK